MNTGSILMGRPSLGRGRRYGLGTENQNMPAFVVLPDPGGWVKGGAPAWGNGYLPPRTRARVVRGGAVADPAPAHPAGRLAPSSSGGRSTSSTQLNREHLAARGDDSRTGRPHRRLRAGVPHAGPRPGGGRPRDGDRGDEAALRPRPQGDGRVRHCAACWPGGWSSAACGSCRSTAATPTAGTPTPTSKATTASCACQSDKPIAGLLTDLKRRGLLEDTLVIWGGEFGRTPMTEGTNGRDHNPHGFTMWLAGGGVKGGQVIGATDAVGLRAAEEQGARPRHPRHDPAPARASTTSG